MRPVSGIPLPNLPYLVLPFLFFCLISIKISSQTISDLRSGIVAYWSFDDSFSADLGEEAFNLTTSAIPPTISGSDATFNAAAQFVRADGNFLKTLSSVNADDADFTYYVRYMPTIPIASGQRYFVVESAQIEHGISFGLRNDGQAGNIPRSEVYTRNTGGTTWFHQPNAAGDYGVAVNTWQDLVVTYSRSSKTYRMYINGVESNTTLVHTGTLKGGGLVIGSFRDNNGRFWEGAIDEVTIWNRVLPISEIGAVRNTKLKINLEKATVATLNASDVSFSIASGENLTTYYKVVPGNSACPTASDLQSDVLAGTLVLNTAASAINISSLTPETNYKLCHVAVDADNRRGAVLETSFATNAVLPVTLLSFSGTAENTSNVLKWSTSSEQNSANFIVEHSLNGMDFRTIGTIKAAGVSNRIRHYQYIHDAPAAGNNFYRLKQEDTDGHSSYSRTLNIKGVSDTRSFIVLVNPVEGRQLRLRVTNKLTASLFTANGKPVWKKDLLPGVHTIDMGSVASGFYLLQSGRDVERIILR